LQGFAREAVKMPGSPGNAGSEVKKTGGILKLENFFRRNFESGELVQRQINPAALCIRTDITQDIGELQRLSQMNRVFMARGIFVSEDFNAEQAHDGSNPVTVEFQGFVGLVTLNVEIHFDALQQRIEMLERQSVLKDYRLELTVDIELRILIAARLLNIGAPRGELVATLGQRHGFIVSNVVNLTAKSVESRHGVAFGPGQQDEGEREIRRAAPRNATALLHELWGVFARRVRSDRRQAASLSQSWIAGTMVATTTPFSAPFQAVVRDFSGSE